VSVVIDASVALKWVIDEPGSEAAAELRRLHLIAPAFWLAEAANALWRLERTGQISTEQANMRLSGLLSAPVAAISIEPYLGEALALAARLNHPVYDCLYLALAIANDTHVITADRRFAAAADRPGSAGRVRVLQG